jgi:uncharacterized membrane protein YfcA
MHDIVNAAANFINLDIANITYLFLVGFVGGLVSGFIGSGGVFVLTPGMMSMGVPGLVAVASNMCHKADGCATNLWVNILSTYPILPEVFPTIAK